MPPIAPPEAAPQVPMLGLKTVWFQVAGTLCNLRCSHCFISCSPENDSHAVMTRAQVKGYLDEARELGAREFYFTGGEPFMNKELPGILEDALAIGPSTVLTNGMLVTEASAARLEEIRGRSPHPLEFRVSLDGPIAESNDRIRGPGVFEKALKGIRLLRAAGFEPILTACRTDDSVPEPEFRRPFEALARSLGQETPRLKILPPLRLGAMESLTRPYRPEERVTDACVAGFDWEGLQCSTARMASAEGVYVCPILIDEPGALMGRTLRETLRPFPLAYAACYTCRAQGLSCANEPPRTGPEAKKPVSREDVKQFYAEAATEPRPNLCCPGGYAGEDTSHIPKEVLERAYGCGSPVGLAGVGPGETVVDLGSGAGIDVFVAARKAGPRGRVIGVDMTPEMLAQALVSAGPVARSLGYRNVEFRHGYLEEIPVEDGAADLVTSNCVLNLSTDKGRVLREIARVLREGGRFVIADIVSERPVPEGLRRDKALWGECLTGALLESEFLGLARAAGLSRLEVLKRGFYREVEGFRFLSVVVRGWKLPKELDAGVSRLPVLAEPSSCCSPASGGKGCC